MATSPGGNTPIKKPAPAKPANTKPNNPSQGGKMGGSGPRK